MRHRGQYLFEPVTQREWDILHDHMHSGQSIASNDMAERTVSGNSSAGSNEASSSDDEDSEVSDTPQSSAREDELQYRSPDLNASGNLVLPGGLVAGCRERRRLRGPQRASGRWQITPVDHKGSVPSLKYSVRLGNLDDIQAALARRDAERLEWVGALAAVRTRQEHAPRLRLDVVAKGFYDGGSKTNNERGDGCHGQGKRHQNAAVHGQPKRNGGRLPKWA
jgi:hypothetical protein